MTALEKALVTRGVTPAAATELVASHPAHRIWVKIEVFDWLVESGDRRVSKNPAGYLVQSIREDYVAPKGFETKASREERRRVEEARRQSAEERRARLRAREEERREVRKDPVRRYWNSLSAIEQDLLKEEALAEADPWLLERYEEQKGEKPHLAQPFLEIIIDRFIEKHRLPPS